MNDQDKTREELIAENDALRRRITELEAFRPIAGDRNGPCRVNDPQWHSLVANTPVFILILDRNQCICFANHTESGAMPDRIIGKNLCDFCRPENRDAVRACVDRVLRTGEPGMREGPGLRSGDQERWYASYFGPIFENGKVVAVSIVSINVTDRKQAEHALRESERRLSTLMSNLPGMAYRCRNDPRWTMEFVSDGCLPLLGYDARQMTGDQAVHLGNLIHPDDRQSVWEQVQQANAERRRFQLTYRIRTAQAEERWVWEQGVGVFSEGGEVVALEGFITDVTDRKRVEQALQKAHDELERRVEERTAELTKANEELVIFRKFAESSSQGFGMADLDSRIVYVNPTMCRLIGEATPRDVVGKPLWSYYPEGGKERRADEILPALERDGSWEGELPLLSRQGTLVSTLHHIFLLRDEEGIPVRRATVVTDITERKRAEEALRASEEQYELAVRGAGVGIWDYDIRTGKVYYSPRWKTIFGFGESEIGDRLDDWARLLHPDERDWVLKFQEDFLAGTSPTVTVEYRLRHKDGSYRWIVAHALVVRDQQGRARRLVGSHGDITDRKRAEEALEREHRTLKHLLQSSDHERQIIAYEIHDGLAQQLAAAIMQFDAFDHLKQNNPKQAADAYHAGMTMLRQGHFEARRLISGVRPPILDEAGIVAAISHMVNEEKRRSGPKIEYLSKVEFDRLTPILENAIYRIAQEALTNACRHSKSKKVHVELVQQGDRIRIEVQDHGVGFKPEDVGESRFGLEGIRERARLLGGKATIETQLGHGTRVVVELPVVLRRPEDEPPAEIAE